MSFDWLRFLQTRGIEYVEHGPNVARNNVNVRCPLCGEDPSHHMGISLSGAGWGCWRDNRHRGKSSARLVQLLLKCTWQHACEIVGTGTSLPDDFAEYVRLKMQGKVDRPTPAPLHLPEEFKPFRDLPSARPFIKYLERRNFSHRQIMRLTDDYGIRYCTRGSYKGRVMFPVHYDRALVSWTGRTIYPQVDLRYKSLSADPEVTEREGLGTAIGPISDYLLWYDDLMQSDADTIFVEEGPFDALKTTVLGKRHGVVATCFFTGQPTESQIAFLHDLLPKFKRRYLLLDQGTLPKALHVQSLLTGLAVEVAKLPGDLKDPGMLVDERQLLRIVD